jgi:predicted SnoaL-like aldol condensation-catalyzing enzyme
MRLISSPKTNHPTMKSLCLCAAIVLCALAACNHSGQAGSASSAAQKNLDVMHIVDKAFETGDVSRIEDAVAADFVDHTENGDMNRDSLKVMIARQASLHMKIETQKEVADSDYVFAMMRYSGTGDGVMMPAGPFDMHGVEVVRFKDGKAVEHWAFVNAADMMKMMSQMQGTSAQMPAKADSAMKK